jgi:RNA polymerase sigma-70 factor (ECF subfamily)
MPSDGPDAASAAHQQRFATTRWSLVVAAAGVDPAASREACAALCSAYWYPLYAFVRRSGLAPPDAEDLTQAFFARLLETGGFAAANRDRGKFRSFLLAAMKHYLANQRDRDRAQKRGGGRAPLSLDFAAGESRYQVEPSHELTAERLFERGWAVALLDRVLAKLRQQYAAAGKEALFDRLKVCLAGGRHELPYSNLAAELAMTTGAVKVAAHRLRQRYRDRLRQEIAETVASPAEVEDEIRDLFGTFEA